MTESAQIMYEKAHALRLHQDNLRWTILGGYFALTGGVLALLEKGNLGSYHRCTVAWFAFGANNLVLLIMAVENWYYNLFTNFVHYCEDCFVTKLEPISLRQFTERNKNCISVYHNSYAFVYCIVILTNIFFAHQYLKWGLVCSILYFVGVAVVLLFCRQIFYECFLKHLKCIFDWAVCLKKKKTKGTEQSDPVDVDKLRSGTISCVAVIGSILTVSVCITMYIFNRIWGIKLVSAFLQLEGTVLLASSIFFDVPAIGKGFKEKFTWAIRKFPKFASPAAFDPLRFYFGLMLLFSGITIGFW